MRARIETEDLVLKKAEKKDWRDMYYNLWRHSESAKYMLWNVSSSEEHARERIQRTLNYQATCECAWFVYEKQSGQAIGFAGMEEIRPGVWEDTGIAIGPEFTGKGYGKQILNALVEYAKEKKNAKKFVASCRMANIASHNLQMSCGFQFSHTEERVDPRTGEAYTLEFTEKVL